MHRNEENHDVIHKPISQSHTLSLTYENRIKKLGGDSDKESIKSYNDDDENYDENEIYKERRKDDKKNGNKIHIPILMTISCWYVLGVLSISTTKILLTSKMTPLLLSVQQFTMGASLLYFILEKRIMVSMAGMGDGMISIQKLQSIR